MQLHELILSLPQQKKVIEEEELVLPSKHFSYAPEE